jgi:hypothetical protein
LSLPKEEREMRFKEYDGGDEGLYIIELDRFLKVLEKAEVKVTYQQIKEMAIRIKCYVSFEIP